MARRQRRLATRRGKLIAAGVMLLIGGAGVGLAAALAPGISRTKHAQATAAAAAQARALDELQARERRDQVLHEEVVDFAAAPGRDLHRLLERELSRAILADARARVRAGTMSGPVRSVSCGRYPRAPKAAGDVGSFACLAVIGLVRQRPGGPVAGQVGDPFWARIDFAQDRLAWCKITPRPGEMAYGRAPVVPLSPICDLSRAAPPGW